MSTLLTLETLKEHLEKIDYSIRGSYPNRFIFNHKGENLWIRVWAEKLEIKETRYCSIIFSFDKNFLITRFDISYEGFAKEQYI
jgi:hypothetical protein